MAHPLAGADPGTLWRVFREAGQVDRRGAALGIWGAVLARAPFSALEYALTAPRLPQAREMPPPIFILGHWRSGTTHLYNLMGLAGFAYAPPLAVGLPWDFLGLGRLLRPVLERQLPERRYIDDIPVTPTSPQEDEIGIASMSPLSFYHGIYFPRAFDRLIDRGIFFDGAGEAEIAAWRARLIHFFAKLSHSRPGRRLLVKNPAHTARPAMLREMFPGAKFIHIHRNPFKVFLSMRNFYTKLLQRLALQEVPAELDIDSTILRVYARMMHRYEVETAGWTAPQLVELSYETLDSDPLGALRLIWEQLELEGFEAAAPRFRAYLEGVRGYRGHRFEADTTTMAKVEAALGPWIARWGYAAPEPLSAPVSGKGTG